jgi:hypothetical protein
MTTSGQIKDEMGRSCKTHETEEKMQNLGGKTKVKKTARKLSRCRRESEIKTNLR